MWLLCGLIAAGGARLTARATPQPQPSIFPLESGWVATFDAPPAQLPASDGTRIYVALRGGRLVAVSLTDGATAWAVDQPTSRPPAPGDGLVFIATDLGIRALDAATGAARWQIRFDAAVSAPPLWDAGWLIVGLANGDLLAYRASDGHPIWRQPLGDRIRIVPSISGDRVYVPLQDGRIVALDLLTGAAVWTRALGGEPAPILAVDDRLFLGTTDNFLYCLAREDGTVKWRWRTGGDILGAPIVDQKHVYFVSLDNQIRALDRRSGVQRWKRELPTRPVAGPRQVDPVLLLTGRAPVLQLYYARDGRPAGRFTLPGELAAPPLVFTEPGTTEATLVFLTGEGRLAAFRPAVGPALQALAYLPGFDREATAVSLGPLDYMPGWRPVSRIEHLAAFDYQPGLQALGPPLAPLDHVPGRRFPPPLTRLLYLPGLRDFEPELAPLNRPPGTRLTLPILRPTDLARMP